MSIVLIATFAILALASVFFFRSNCGSQAQSIDESSVPAGASNDEPQVDESRMEEVVTSAASERAEPLTRVPQEAAEAPTTTVGNETLAQGVRLFMSARYEEALPLVEPAAHEGHLRAQQIMAKMYYAGHGVAQDKEQYLYWLKQAADNGDKPSKIKVKKIESELH